MILMNTNFSEHICKAMGVALVVIWMFSVAPPRLLRAATLQALVQREWEYELHEDPQLATAVGDRRYNGIWNDYSISAIEEQQRDLANWFRLFEDVDPKTLDEEGRLNRELMLRHLKQRLTSLRIKAYEMPINPHSGVHLQVIETISVTPFDNASDYAQYLERLRGLPRVIEDWIAVLQRGKRDRLVPFRHLVEESIAQCKAIGEAKGMNSPFSKPLEHFPDSMPESQRNQWRQTILAAIETNVRPEYTKLADYLIRNYAPACQKEPGLWALPDGDARYRFAIQEMTTTDLDPDSIHQLGLREVQRIEKAQEQIAHRLGYGSIREFRWHLREKRELVPQSGEQLLGLYRDYISQMQAALPRMFHIGTPPPLEVRAAPKYSESAAASAKYLQAPPDGSRPAILLINTGHLQSRTLIGVESTAYHEGVPGHHLQISIALRLAIPEFRREGSFVVFTEGWALYAEGLGQELGFYRTPYSEYGRLSNELLRAIRLVVDTGIHYQHWTRQQVVDYFHENSSEDEPTVQSETDRYIAQPAQALAYKIGEQTILELRRQAQSALGNHFQLQDFHEQVLGEGSIPLDMLRIRVKQWIAHRAVSSK
jgi:uncharacterized protein (DUF885 family)